MQTLIILLSAALFLSELINSTENSRHRSINNNYNIRQINSTGKSLLLYDHPCACANVYYNIYNYTCSLYVTKRTATSLPRFVRNTFVIHQNNDDVTTIALTISKLFKAQ